MSVVGDLLTSTLAGLAFIPCAMASVSSTPSPQTRRREVVVNGKRVKTIDVHAHCIVPAAAAVINHPLEAPGLLMHDTSTRIAAMDAQGIDVEALSINPYWYRAARDAAAELIRIQNEALVRVLRCQPGPLRRLRDGRAAVSRPRRRAARARGQDSSACAASAWAAASPARSSPIPEFHPFWAKGEELGVLVFMHPQGTRELEPCGRLAGNGLLTNTIGNPLDTTIALSHLIFEGTLDRFPGLKICAAHGGGFLPSYADRSDAVIRCFPDRVGPLPKKQPTAYLRDGQLYLRHDRVHVRGAAPPDRGDRSGPDHDRHRLPVPVDQHRGRPRAQHAGLHRRRAHRHPRRDRGAAARHSALILCRA